MAKGEHFLDWRHLKGVPFQHHGIDLGDGTAVHFTDGNGGVAGPGSDSSDFQIQHTSIELISRQGRDRLHVIAYQDALPADQVVERALSQVGRQGYHLLFDNCEHFACWCVIDRDESRQVSVACERLSAASLKAITAGTIRIASKSGVKRVMRGASPWMLVADAAQWITEAGGHHVGLRDPLRRKHAGRAVGMTTALGIGACGGPAGLVVAGGIWIAGEVVGEVSRTTYDKIRDQRKSASC
ncbi:MAG: lecithin retinol acyltransferase family protein [Rubripirellula sp.]